jgi:hypothetical protein
VAFLAPLHSRSRVGTIYLDIIIILFLLFFIHPIVYFVTREIV